ncbi:MAG: adenylyltransferase/cytidyltransferase family protein [Deltaproteobacteria bacterium]|nr:adenylyltransferase/cytidyltransferase family protein [Deltaproteobacteria bacterium]MBW1871469.1 adenylyltransferase/cytidyltransferase family protein [Deltaproteobacteria bacterium]
MSAKVIDMAGLVAELANQRAAGRTVALTNGAFDLLHVGHLRYLVGASRLADILVVAINSDDSVRRLKGADRPIYPENERLELVAALEVVDYVVLFEQDDVRDVIRKLKPDVHVKGTDYTPETIPERDEVLDYGGQVAVAGDPKDHSTSEILKKFSKGN